MESKALTCRFSLTLLAVVVLSALSAAEATLAGAPRFEGVENQTWPAQLSAVRDRDSAQPRVTRPDDTKNQDRATAEEHHSSTGPAANLCESAASLHRDTLALLPSLVDHLHIRSALSPHRLSLPPPRV